MFLHKKEAYLKDDGSIEGGGYHAEIVTQPHTFKALMKKGSILDSISKLNITERDANGMHIHISRTAFVSDKHYGLWYFLLHKLEKVATLVGGRELTTYCKLQPYGKVATKKNSSNTNQDRQLYLNERNTPTVEARFFLATTKLDRLKANVQLLESLIKYTKYHSKYVSASGWYKYINKYSKKYKELLGVLEGKELDLDSIPTVIHKEPKRVRVTPDKLKVIDVPNMVGFKSKDSDKEVLPSSIFLQEDMKRIAHRMEGDMMHKFIPLYAVEYVILERED
jgi:hypothetical protein